MPNEEAMVRPMREPKQGERRIRLRCPETRRLRTYDVDEELDPDILQRLNDLAFLYGVEIVSTCVGHDTGWDGDEDDVFAKQASFAEIRFSALYPQSLRLDAQRARVCIELLAMVVAGGDSVTEVEHGIVMDPEQPRCRRLAESFLTVRYSQPTWKDPEGARTWWERMVRRMAFAPAGGDK